MTEKTFGTQMVICDHLVVFVEIIHPWDIWAVHIQRIVLCQLDDNKSAIIFDLIFAKSQMSRLYFKFIDIVAHSRSQRVVVTRVKAATNNVMKIVSWSRCLLSLTVFHDDSLL